MSERGKVAAIKKTKDPAFVKDATERHDVFNKKWAAPLLLGPLVPALFAIIIIVGGNVILNKNVGVCGYPLKDFLSGAIFLSYVFLILYSWVFLGDFYSIYIPFVAANVTILKPITSLRFLITMYSILAFGSIICWSIGSFYLSAGIFCVTTAPLLYSFTLFVIVSYWIGFFIIFFYVIKLIFGSAITASIAEGTRAPTDEELEDQIFRKAFQKLDTRKRNKIASSDLKKLFVEIGVYVAEDDVKDLEQQLDPTESGDIEFYTLLKWFKAFRLEADKNDKNANKDKPKNKNDDDDDDDEKDD